MGSDYVMLWGDDVLLIERCHSLRDAYKIGINFLIKEGRGAFADRDSLHPPADKKELRAASKFFKQNCRVLAVNCYL